MKPDSPFFPRCLNALNQSSLFKNLEDQKLTEMLVSFNRITWAKNASIMTDSQSLKYFYVIVSGRMKVSQINPDTGRELTLFLLGPGDVFDIICLLDEQEHAVQVTALDELEALYAPLGEVRHWIETHADFNKTLLPYLGKQLRSLEELASDLTLHDTLTRLSRLILRYVDIDNPVNKLKLINDLSHEELGNMIGSVRVVTSRQMQKLKEADIIHKDRTKMEIKNLHSLLKQAQKKMNQL